MAWVPSGWAAGQLSNPAGQLVLWATSWWRPRDLHGRGWYLDTGVYSAEPAARRPGVREFGQKSCESYLGEKTQVYWISRWGKYDRYSPILSILPHPPRTLFLHPSCWSSCPTSASRASAPKHDKSLPISPSPISELLVQILLEPPSTLTITFWSVTPMAITHIRVFPVSWWRIYAQRKRSSLIISQWYPYYGRFLCPCIFTVSWYTVGWGHTSWLCISRTYSAGGCPWWFRCGSWQQVGYVEMGR